MSAAYSATKMNKVRVGNRADYDHEAVHAILDAGMVGHVGFIDNGRPIVIPMLYARDGETLYLHGAKAARLIKMLAGGAPVCVEVTHVDGIVVARSAMHSSMNYRSVVVHGTARAIEIGSDEHTRALELITEQVIPGRWAEVRPMLDKEVKATGVIAVSIDEAAAKARDGEPVDEEADYADPVWGGVVPVKTVYGPAEGDSRLLPGVDVPASVSALTKNG
ncbi:MAG: pyridoxamine 5'-phosphate oxidase family protein [Hyphomicrobiales bacterium]|nr:MAG: pyridoxamine 5'-phosphate oxidase family protein [Hyphomicrobiales bacterium]